jgi:hypothetical protein
MNAKKIIILAGSGVLIYSLIVHPVELGNGVQTALGWLTTGVESAVMFARTVFT